MKSMVAEREKAGLEKTMRFKINTRMNAYSCITAKTELLVLRKYFHQYSYFSHPKTILESSHGVMVDSQSFLA
jgi:hypothetical protein